MQVIKETVTRIVDDAHKTVAEVRRNGTSSIIRMMQGPMEEIRINEEDWQAFMTAAKAVDNAIQTQEDKHRYFCDCGRGFETPQGLGGHRSACKVGKKKADNDDVSSIHLGKRQRQALICMHRHGKEWWTPIAVGKIVIPHRKDPSSTISHSMIRLMEMGLLERTGEGHKGKQYRLTEAGKKLAEKLVQGS